MDSSWFTSILTAFFSVWFVILVLDFNAPARKLREQYDRQNIRCQDLQQKLDEAKAQNVEGKSTMETLEEEWNKTEMRRQVLLPKVNQRLMVHIPSGNFTMGSKFEDSAPSERPSHIVLVDEFYIAATPVTNQEYRDFVNCTGAKAPIHWQRGSYRAGTARHPVTNVTWREARIYAEWAEARLPTEAEWEKAVRGDDERLYPWGSRWLDDRCNCMNRVGTTLPVDEYPVGRSAYGLWDAVGNAYEWCEDFYDKDYYKTSPDANPKGPERGEERVIRGGCYMETRAGVRAAHRGSASETYARDSIGFRIAMSPKD